MADQHRKRRPRDESFETPIFKAAPGDSNQFPYEVHGTPPTFDQIPSRLYKALKHIYRVEFLRSKVDYASDQDADKWKIWRYLGDGSFGSAALWVKHDNNGNIIDEIVMKDVTDSLEWHRREPNLAKEAVLQSTVNKMGCQNIVHLRAYKVYLLPDYIKSIRDVPSPRYHARHYLEYAPYGDLDTLRARYKAHNRYLPELFLWHVFNSLAKAAIVLERFQAGQIHNMDTEVNDYILHLDIKPANIFLGYEEVHEPMESTGGLHDGVFPSIKLGDFGLAVYTHQEDDQNPRSILRKGTPGFEAPEVEDVRIGRDPAARSQKITSKSHVWNIGKVLYDLATLASPTNYMFARAHTQETYRKNGNSPLPNYDRTPYEDDRLHARSPYSRELIDLIEDCMQVSADLRTTPRRLYEETHRMLQQRFRDRESANLASVRNRKLYYRGTDIRNILKDEKNCEHEYDWHLHDKLHNFRTIGPDDLPFRLGVKNIVRSDSDTPFTKVPYHANIHRVRKKKRAVAARTFRLWSNNHNVRLRDSDGLILFGLNDPYVHEGDVGLYPGDMRFRRTSLDISSDAMSDSSNEGGNADRDNRAKWYNQFRDQDKRYHRRRGLQTPPTAREQHANIHRAMRAVNRIPGDATQAEIDQAWQDLWEGERDEYNADDNERAERYNVKRTAWQTYYPTLFEDPPRSPPLRREAEPQFPSRVRHPVEPINARPDNRKEYFQMRNADKSIDGMQSEERQDRYDQMWDELGAMSQSVVSIEMHNEFGI